MSARSSRETMEFPSPTDEDEPHLLPVDDPDVPPFPGSDGVEFPPPTDEVVAAPLPLPDAVQPLRSSTEALEFLSLIDPEELQLCLFGDSLVTISETGRELGEFTASVQRAVYEEEGKDEVECYLVHASSQGALDDAPCGTSIIAYISKKLETLEQHRYEYLTVQGSKLNKNKHMVKRGEKLVINKVITQDEVVEEENTSYDWSSLEGFVSEGSNILLMRVLAKRQVIPQNMTFLAFDMESNLCICTYGELGIQMQTIGKANVELFGIERNIWSEEDLPNTWHSFFLSDGHLASRVQVGSPVSMKLLTMPVLVEKEEQEPKPVFGKQVLEWEEDVQLYSRFLDRKEELRSDHATYIRRHPDVRILMADFLQFLLLRKPDDIVAFAAEFFAPFATARSPTSAFHASYEPSPFLGPCQ
ncbi:ciliogenesis-associated TTC17-interacting protein isoform X2 [Ambystoma mexicanum]